MADLSSILTDPNYVNANPATKQAIFDKFSATDSNFTKANPATQDAIRLKFGLSALSSPQEPSTYSKVREFVTPTVEALGAIGGGAAGAVGGPLGAVAGAGLGYAGAKELLKLADTVAGEGGPKESMSQAGVRQAKNVLEGATLETGGRILGQGLGYVGGKIADLRQIPAQKAAKIAQNALGQDLPQVLNTLRSAPANANIAELTAKFENPAWQALVKDALEKDPQFVRKMRLMDEGQSLNALTKLAGGQTAAETRAVSETAKNNLNTITTPMRESALSRANLGKAVAEYEAQAGQLSQEAAAKVADVRRLVNAGNLAEASARLDLIKQGRPVGAAQYTYKGELAQMADEWASKAADASLDLGQGARFAQGAADAMRSVGIKPLEGESLARSISGIANKPEFAGNDLLAGAAKNVADDIAKWTGSGGVVDAKALDAIRKNSVNAAIQQLRPGADATTQRNLAAGVLSKIKPAIDDAIEAAGGEGYKQYLADYAKGMQRINEKKLTGEALRLWKTDKDAFVKLVQNDSPDVVEKFLGPGNYNIAKELADDTLSVLQKEAENHLTKMSVKEQVSEGGAALSQLLKQEASRFRFPSFLNFWASAGNKTLSELERNIGTKSMKQLTEAMKTPEGAANLLETLPASERSQVLKLISDPAMLQSVKFARKESGLAGYGEAQTAAKQAQQAAEAIRTGTAVNALAPKEKRPVNQNAMRIELRGMANKE